MYSRGQNYFKRNAVKNLKFVPESNSWMATVNGSEPYLVHINLESDDYSHHCSCPAHDTFGECKHVVAVLFKIAEKSSDEQETKKASQKDQLIQTLFGNSRPSQEIDHSSMLIDAFTDSLKSNNQMSQNLDVLETEFTLILDRKLWLGYQFSIEMKVGVGRTYVVKNLKRFIESVMNQDEHMFTPNFSYQPDQHMFTSYDDQIIKILIDIYKNDEFYDSRFSQGSSSKGMVIPPAFADQLLPLLAESGAEFKDELRNYSYFECAHDIVPFDFQLNESSQGYELNLSLMPHANYIKNYDLIQVNNSLFKLNDQQKEVVDRSFKHIQGLDKIHIQPHQIDTFISQVLPNLEQIGQVELSEKVSESMVKPTLKTTMHLDWDGLRLTAQVRYNYHNISIDPMKPSNSHQPKDKILVRDHAKEQQVMRFIEHAGFKYNGDELYLNSELEIFSFLYEQLPVVEDEVDVYLTQAVKNLLFDEIDYPTINVDYDSNQNYLEVNFDIGDIDHEEISQLLQSVVERKRYYRLPNGSFVPLQDESLTQMTHLLNDLNLNLKMLKMDLYSYRRTEAYS